MSEEKNIKSIKRFGARYGIKTKQKYGLIEKEQRKKHKCPYCNGISVRRISLGIWLCKRCNSKFTGKAYSITKKITFKEEDSKEESPKEEAGKETAKEETN